MHRTEIADLILDRINQEKNALRTLYNTSSDRVGYFYVDDLLPEDVARKIHDAFPSPERMKRRKSLREYKYVAAQMDRYDPILEEAVYAFQDPCVVALIRELCGMGSLYPDEYLYAGGHFADEQGAVSQPASRQLP